MIINHMFARIFAKKKVAVCMRLLFCLSAAVMVVMPVGAKAAAKDCTSQNGHCALSCDTVNGETSLGINTEECNAGGSAKNQCCSKATGASVTVTQTASYGANECKIAAAGVSFPCPLGEANRISELIGRLIKWSLGIAGACFFAMFVYGGFMYIIAGENSKNAEAGKTTLVNATIGLAIVIGGYMLVQFLLNVIGAGLGTSSGTSTVPSNMTTCAGTCKSACKTPEQEIPATSCSGQTPKCCYAPSQE